MNQSYKDFIKAVIGNNWSERKIPSIGATLAGLFIWAASTALSPHTSAHNGNKDVEADASLSIIPQAQAAADIIAAPPKTFKPIDLSEKFGHVTVKVAPLACPRKSVFETDPDQIIEQASLTKPAVLLMIARAIKDGKLNLADKFHIPPIAIERAQKGNIAAFDNMDKGEFTLEFLVKAVGVKSDAIGATALPIIYANAYGWGGTDTQKIDRFLKETTEFTQRIGMKGTIYKNPIGLKGNVSTADNEFILFKYFQENYPDLFKEMLGTRYYDFKGHASSNYATATLLKNGQISEYVHAKTGALGIRTSDPTYNQSMAILINPDTPDAARIVSVVIGSDSKEERTTINRYIFDALQGLDVKTFCTATTSYDQISDLPRIPSHQLASINAPKL